jgi:hypothetical protein
VGVAGSRSSLFAMFYSSLFDCWWASAKKARADDVLTAASLLPVSTDQALEAAQPPDSRRAMISALGQAAVNLFYQVFDSDMSPKPTGMIVMVLLDAQVVAEAIQHLNNLGCLPFGQQVHL